MEVAGVCLCRGVALALFGHNMEEMGAGLAADGAQRALQLCFVMAVNGSEIMEPHILKHGRMVHGPAHHALTALNGGFERRTDHGDPIQKRPDVLFCINVTARGAQMAEIPCQRTNVFGNGHLVVVEDHQQVVQPANVVHPLVDHAARERAIANDGNHMARLPPQFPGPSHANSQGERSVAVTRHKGVMDALFWVGETGNAIQLPQLGKALPAAGQQFMGIALMTDAARMVNSGMEKLSLAQLVEVHAVLKGDENSAGLFRLVSGYARGQLSVYARSTEDFQSQMTLEDAGALRELAEEVGFDKDDNLTKDGQKALEIAARVSKRAKDKKVEEAVAAAKEQPDKEENRLESISLTPEQIKYLDEKGIVHNGTLESIAWFKDRDEAMKILADAGAKPEETPRAPIAEIEEDNVAENVNENNLGSVDISKNMQQLEMLSASVNPLDENDKSFADNRASLNVLDVYDEKGVKHDVKSELVEQAKLRTEAEMLDAKKVTKEEYVERLKLNIDSAVYSVVTGNAVDFSHYNGNREHLQQVLKNKIDVLAKAEGGSKPSKAHVRLESVLGFMAVAGF